MEHGLHEIDAHRRIRTARAGRPHARHLGKHRQRRIRPRRRRAAIPTAARSRPSAPRSTARSTRRSWRSAASKTDTSEFRVKYEPGHPAADANGNVKYPNVNSLVEMTDMREAQRSYEANVNVIGATRRMIQRTLDILKS